MTNMNEKNLAIVWAPNLLRYAELQCVMNALIFRLQLYDNYDDDDVNDDD